MPIARARKRRFMLLTAKLALSLMAIVISVGGLEIGTRLLTDTQPPLLRNHHVLGTTYRPGFQGKVYVKESRQDVDLRFNRDGVRGAEYNIEKGPNVRRIAVLGDSMIAAIGAAEDDTAVRELESRLMMTPGNEKWEVMNFGISGSATGQELVFYREVVRKYQPDIVVCAFCIWNDFSDNSRRLSSSPHRIYFTLNNKGHLRQLPLPKSKSVLSEWLNQHSRFYVWQKHATRVAASRAKNHVGKLPKSMLVYVSDPSEELEHSWRLTESLIDTLRQEVEADGSEFVLALLPSADQIHKENWRKAVKSADSLTTKMDPDYPSDRLTDYCHRNGVPVINMVEAFRAAAPHRSRQRKDEWLHYGGVGHFNQAGNRLAAAQIYDYIIDERISRRPGSSPGR